MPDIAIKVDGVTKIYAGRVILDAIKLDVRQGETLVILGGSGSGKSTMLRLMIGNVRVDGGDIIGLGRAIALDPRILFYDEPSAGLDPVTSAEIDQLIIDLNRKLGVTSVVVTHEMDSAFRIADRMVLLDRGKFIVSGTADELRNSTDPLVRQFVHGLTEGPLTDRRRGGGYESDLLGERI